MHTPTRKHTNTTWEKSHTALPTFERIRSLLVFKTLRILKPEAFITSLPPEASGTDPFPFPGHLIIPLLNHPLSQPFIFLSNPQFQLVFFFLTYKKNLLRSGDAKMTPARAPRKFACSELWTNGREVRRNVPDELQLGEKNKREGRWVKLVCQSSWSVTVRRTVAWKGDNWGLTGDRASTSHMWHSCIHIGCVRRGFVCGCVPNISF